MNKKQSVQQNVEMFLEIFLMSKKDGSDLHKALKEHGTPEQITNWEPILKIADFLYETKGEKYLRRSLKEFIAKGGI